MAGYDLDLRADPSVYKTLQSTYPQKGGEVESRYYAL